MHIGLNITGPRGNKEANRLLSEGHCNFYEILIDNFFHLDEIKLKESISDNRISFHIMSSCFLERDIESLKEYGKKIRSLIRLLNPFYVSDHIARFTNEGRRLLTTFECDYKIIKNMAIERIKIWQDILDHNLYFENFPSIINMGYSQIDFFSLTHSLFFPLK